MVRTDPHILEKILLDGLPAFNDALKGFRPTMGNQEHIWLVKSIGALKKLEEQAMKALKANRGSKKLVDDIVFKRQNIISQLERLKCQTKEVQ